MSLLPFTELINFLSFFPRYSIPLYFILIYQLHKMIKTWKALNINVNFIIFNALYHPRALSCWINNHNNFSLLFCFSFFISACPAQHTDTDTVQPAIDHRLKKLGCTNTISFLFIPSCWFPAQCFYFLVVVLISPDDHCLAMPLESLDQNDNHFPVVIVSIIHPFNKHYFQLLTFIFLLLLLCYDFM